MIYWRRAWQPTPVLLPGEPHGQRSLVGYRETRLKQVSMHAYTNNRVPRYMKQTLTELKGETDSSALIDGDFKTLISIMEGISYTVRKN